MIRTEFARRTALLSLALLVTGLVYWTGLTGPLLYDDALNLSPVIQWYHGLLTWQEVIHGNISGPLGRPVSMLSYLLSGAFGVEPFHFKLGNLIVHLLCGLVGFALLRRLLAHDPRLAPHAALLAFAVCALWLLHPLHVSTVLYAVQRMAQLSTLATLLAVLVYVVAREKLAQGQAHDATRGLFVLFPLVLLVGVFSKENAAVAPALCLVVELAYFSRGWRMPRRIGVFFGAFVLLPAIAGTALLLVAPDRLLEGYALREFGLTERLLTQARALVDYVSQIILPRPEQMSVYTDDYPASTGVFTPPTTAISIGVLLTLSALAVWFRRTMPVAFLGWFFFLVAHAVESSILPLDLYYEHRNYLPSFGLILAIVGSVATLLATRGTRRPMLPVAIACSVLALLLALQTYGQARVWRDMDAILAQTLQHHPTSLRANLTHSRLLGSSGRVDEAREILDTLARSENPHHRLTARLRSIALDCETAAAPDAALLDRAVAEAPSRLTMDDVAAVNFLLGASKNSACPPLTDLQIGTTFSQLASASTLQSDRFFSKRQVRYAAALAFARSGLWAEALPQATLAWQPGADIEVGALLVRALVIAGNADSARGVLREMEIRSARHSPRALAALGQARALIAQSGRR